MPLRVPGLAERREDIPDLIQYFVTQLSSASGLSPRRIGEDAIAVLQAHDWPGNVRELRNNIERLMILAGGDPSTIITADMLPEEIGSNVPLPVNGGAEHLMSLPLREAREIFEREYLLAQINRFGGNISRTAEFVGMERSALHRKLRALGVSSDQRGTEMKQSLASNRQPASGSRAGQTRRQQAGMTRVVYVNGQLSALCAGRRCMWRIADFSSRIPSTRCARSSAGASSTSRATWSGSGARSASLAIPMPMSRAALGQIMREIIRRNRVTTGLLYLQVREARHPRLLHSHKRAHADMAVLARQLDGPSVKPRGRGHSVSHDAGHPVGPLGHQDRDAIAGGAGQGCGRAWRGLGGLAASIRRDSSRRAHRAMRGSSTNQER